MEGMEIRSPRVLVADDDENVREVTREMLRGLAWRRILCLRRAGGQVQAALLAGVVMILSSLAYTIR